MNAFRGFVVNVGARIPLAWLVAVLVALNISWLVILAAVGEQFERLAGIPLLDLQNSVLPGEAMTPSRALTQIASYPPEAIGLYWSFFILDNVMPPLVFGTFALLWANLLHRRPGRLRRLVLGTAVILVPFGVGAFDWIENLAYITAVGTADTTTATTAMRIGLVAKWIKAAFLQATFLITMVVVVGAVLGRRRAARTATAEPTAPAPARGEGDGAVASQGTAEV